MTLRDNEGVVHLATRANDSDAWWTPIACGHGIALPGPQRRDEDQPPTCPECIRARPGATIGRRRDGR